MVEFNKLVQAQFDKMCKTGKLFRSSVTGQEVWDLYLSSFLEGTNPIFRDPSSTVHNCNFCKNFIRRYGNIVSINEDLSFLDQTTEVKTDSKVQLAFDILKEIYLTKKSEQEAQNKAAENKIYNQKIFQFLASKRESDLQKELEGKSEEEILSMIK